MQFKDLKPGDVFSFEVAGAQGVGIRISTMTSFLNCGNYHVGSMALDREVTLMGRLDDMKFPLQTTKRVCSELPQDLIEKLKLHRFEESDWQLYAGADKFPGGDDPWAGTFPVANWPVDEFPGRLQGPDVVYSGDGSIQIHGGDCALMKYNMTHDQATALLMLIAGMTAYGTPWWTWERLRDYIRWDHVEAPQTAL